jgi:signal transduction histidine kinase
MKRIASGDFSVPLDSQDLGKYRELAGSINAMAKGLGSLECLRRDFVSNVSHEIQSPLTSIGGYAALLENDALEPALRKHYLDIIKAESVRLSKLSSNLLKLSSLDSGVTPSPRFPSAKSAWTNNCEARWFYLTRNGRRKIYP